MHRCRILLDREKLHSAGHPPCHSFIPVRIGDEGVSIRIVMASDQSDHSLCERPCSEVGLASLFIRNCPEPANVTALVRTPSTKENPLVLVRRPKASAVVK